MRDANKLAEITKFKDEIIKKLYTNTDIIEVLDCPDMNPEEPDTAEWTCIFPYIKLPGIQEKVGNFIGVKVDTIDIADNPLYKRVEVIFSIICALPTLRVPGQKGTRTDILGGDIIEVFNWNNTMGLTLKLAGEQEGVFENYNFYYRNLKFYALKSNSIEDGNHRYQKRR